MEHPIFLGLLKPAFTLTHLLQLVLLTFLIWLAEQHLKYSQAHSKLYSSRQLTADFRHPPAIQPVPLPQRAVGGGNRPSFTGGTFAEQTAALVQEVRDIKLQMGRQPSTRDELSYGDIVNDLEGISRQLGQPLTAQDKASVGALLQKTSTMRTSFNR